MEENEERGIWAPSVERLAEGAGVNLDGRRLTGPQQGFGPMWQKTYRITVPGVEPERVISEWKANYGSFWPRHSTFNAPLAGIQPGEIGGISSMQVMSTGVLVIFSDATSFAFMTPEGHPFAGWITFSSYTDDDSEDTVAQVQLMIRPNDPFWDVFFMVGGGRGEDMMWQHTLRALAKHFEIDAHAVKTSVKVDRKRLWKNARNIRRNAVFGTAIYRVRSIGRRKKERPPAATGTTN